MIFTRTHRQILNKRGHFHDCVYTYIIDLVLNEIISDDFEIRLSKCSVVVSVADWMEGVTKHVSIKDGRE